MKNTKIPKFPKAFPLIQKLDGIIEMGLRAIAPFNSVEYPKTWRIMEPIRLEASAYQFHKYRCRILRKRVSIPDRK